MDIFPFENSYSSLPERFYARLPPTRVSRPELIKINSELAAELGLDPSKLATEQAIEVFAGNRVPEKSKPIALAYAGHQFGGWVPSLGDGRAILLGELRNQSGHLYDLQLKGSGPTPFSRNGDGRAWLGPVIREYIVSEAMHNLGIPSTRTLSIVSTGERVFRERPYPGGILTRVARSHIRVGTFQYFYAREDHDALKLLADYLIDRNYPELKKSENPLLSLLVQVVEGQAKLISEWMAVGFIHGVMNTDNTSLSCETIDFGPCAFMDRFQAAKVFSSIDHNGRYAYANQPMIAHWNLAQFATTLIPILKDEKEAAIKKVTDIINRFPQLYLDNWLSIFGKKLGMENPGNEDFEFITDFLNILEKAEADFTLTFRTLSTVPARNLQSYHFENFAVSPNLILEWIPIWLERLNREKASESERLLSMQKANPAYIPRNHQIEKAIVEGVEGNFDRFNTMVEMFKSPYTQQQGYEEFEKTPETNEVVTKTFCGT
ncbi:MAG: YdiU family protein [Rhodobacteraceae bacterium]|nr:YdiU family protein [Paracoccaceae bacterium]